MNKIDLEILEIVKDYTNKELVEGCFVEYVNNWEKIITNKFNKICFWWKNVLRIEEDWITKYIDFNILWQLEITAITKYIENVSWIQCLTIWDYLCLTDGGWLLDIDIPEQYSIRNKPYNTYTESEKIELRELLLILNK